MHARAARFARQELAHAAVLEWERQARFPRDVARRSGLTGLFCPAGLGGAELSYEDGMAVFEELGRGDAAFAFSMSMHNAVAAAVCGGGGEPAETWGRRLAAGEWLGGFSLTEPHAGSDATAITTRAQQTADGWRVHGRKAWVSLAGEADLFLVVCRTGEAAGGHADVAIAAVERRAPGVSFPVIYDKAAAAFLPIGEMALDGAPAEMLVPAGTGMRAALAAIDVARCDIAAIAAGLHAEALDVALRYARDRPAFGQRVLDFQGIQWMLADVATELEASRLLYRRAAAALGSPDGPVAVAHAKRFCPDAALRSAIACSEVMGAYGWLHDHPLARFVAEAKMLQVVDGTAEVQRIVIGRALARRAQAL